MKEIVIFTPLISLELRIDIITVIYFEYKKYHN